MHEPTTVELACKNAERAVAAEISAQIYKLRCEGKNDDQIVELLLEQLSEYQNK